MVDYYLQKVFGKSDWKVNGSRLFGSYRQNSGSSGISGKDFPYGMFLTEIRVPSLKSHGRYQFQAFAAVFRYMQLICTNGKRNSATTLPVLNFTYHLQKT